MAPPGLGSASVVDAPQPAEELGVTQSRVAGRVRGKHATFSLDTLVTLTARAGRTVKLRLAA